MMPEPTPPGQPIPDRGTILTGLIWVLSSLACMTVFMRFYVRAAIRFFGWDDVFMILTMVCYSSLHVQKALRSEGCIDPIR